MSLDEQHEATQRARKNRAAAEDLAVIFTTEPPVPAEIQIAVGLASIVHLLLAIEDRLTYGYTSILDGTISCKTCRAIVLDSNAEAHYQWHREA